MQAQKNQLKAVPLISIKDASNGKIEIKNPLRKLKMKEINSTNYKEVVKRLKTQMDFYFEDALMNTWKANELEKQNLELKKMNNALQDALKSTLTIQRLRGFEDITSLSEKSLSVAYKSLI